MFKDKVLCLNLSQSRENRKWKGKEQRQTKLQAFITSHSSLISHHLEGHTVPLGRWQGEQVRLSEPKEIWKKKPVWACFHRLPDSSSSGCSSAHSECRSILCPLQTVGISIARSILKDTILATETNYTILLDNPDFKENFRFNLTFDEAQAHCWFLQALHLSSDTGWTAFAVRFLPHSLPEHTEWPFLGECHQLALLQLWQKNKLALQITWTASSSICFFLFFFSCHSNSDP